jgi:hypothetical protein
LALSEASSLRFAHLRATHVVLGRVAEDPEGAIAKLSSAFVDDTFRLVVLLWFFYF